MKYRMGDLLWRATWDAVPASVVCPECGGSGCIRVILHDDTELSIECEGCRRGYNAPSGRRISGYDRQPRAESVIVTGFEVNDDKVEYRTDTTYRVLEADLFEREEDALAAAIKIATAADRSERDLASPRKRSRREPGRGTSTTTENTDPRRGEEHSAPHGEAERRAGQGQGTGGRVVTAREARGDALGSGAPDIAARGPACTDGTRVWQGGVPRG